MDDKDRNKRSGEEESNGEEELLEGWTQSVTSPSLFIIMRAVVLLGLLRAAAAFTFKFSWNGPSAERDPEPNAESACSWDQSSCGCCLMVQEVNRLRTYFNTTLTELQKEFTETDQSLRSVQDSRVAFTVSLHNNNSLKCDGPFSHDRILNYRHAVLNLGAAYDMNTGVFTVPHSGVYSLAVTAFGHAAPGHTLAVCATLQVNGQAVAAAKELNTKDQEDSATVAVALHLQAADKVSVSLAKGCFVCDGDDHYNTFSAFLLYVTE